jgi:catechol 2,3-dioxygenase-like lactoylglutathione lyase family enzyme
MNPESVPPALADVVERFDHVSMAVRSFDAAAPLLALLGAEHFDGGYEGGSDFHWIQYDLPGSGRLELIRTDSTDPGHFINRFLSERGEGLHHLTFKVHDLVGAREVAIRAGFNVVGFNDSDPAWKELFIHPRSASGVLIQFAEFPEKG